jgi:histidinol dehydrogenase
MFATAATKLSPTFAAKFDGAKLAPRAFRVKESEIASARKRLQSVDQKAIESSLEAVSCL